MSDYDCGRLPRGFAGPALARHELVPSRGRVLHLPAGGIADGPFLRLPEGPFDAAVVDGITESLGDLRRFLQALAARLLPGGEVLVDVENAQAPRALHFALAGRPGLMQPVGSLREAERAVSLRSLLEAMDAAGLLALDCVAVPSGPGAGPELARDLVGHGFAAAAYAAGPPPARYWVRGRKLQVRAGSVLLGAGSEELRQRTAAVVEEFLPGDWEVLLCPGTTEIASFNRGVCLSHGEVLWFLRPGATPSHELFRHQLAAVLSAPAVPAAAEAAGGGLCGLMAHRLDLMLAGPLPIEWSTEDIAWEDYGMRLEALGCGPIAVPGGFACPPAPVRDVDLARREAVAFTRRWDGIASATCAAVDATSTRRTACPRGQESAWTDREPRLSLCMVVRDQERLLRECLARAKPAVDQIVVVDAGSSDATAAVAESFGATVLQLRWDDDLSALRNAGVQAATGDWVLVLDAEDRLPAACGAELRELIRDGSACGYYLVLRSPTGTGDQQRQRALRLFRRLPGVVFQGRIADRVADSLAAAGAERDLRISTCDLVVQRLDDAGEVAPWNRDSELVERLLRLQLEAMPDDLGTLHRYGELLRRLPGRGGEALQQAERALDLLQQQPAAEQATQLFAGEIAALCAQELARSGRVAEAEAVIERALGCFTATPHLHSVAGALALRQHRSDEAIAHYRRCLRYRDRVSVIPVEEGLTSWVSLTGMAQGYLQRRDCARALRLLERARRAKPDYEAAALAESQAYCEAERHPEALEVLTDYLAEHPDSAAACQQATEVLARLGLVAEARAMGSRAVRLLKRANLESEVDKMRETVAGLA